MRAKWDYIHEQDVSGITIIRFFSTTFQNWPPSQESLTFEKGWILSSPSYFHISTLPPNWPNKLPLNASTGHTMKVSASSCLRFLRDRRARRGVLSPKSALGRS